MVSQSISHFSRAERGDFFFHTGTRHHRPAPPGQRAPGSGQRAAGSGHRPHTGRATRDAPRATPQMVSPSPSYAGNRHLTRPRSFASPARTHGTHGTHDTNRNRN